MLIYFCNTKIAIRTIAKGVCLITGPLIDTQNTVHVGAKTTFLSEIPQTLMFEKCEFCEKGGPKPVNSVKNETLKM